MSEIANLPLGALPLLPYIYESLPADGSIRVLELQPGPWNAEIRFRMFVINPGSLSDGLYEAISYTWGHPAREVGSICNGRRLNITTSLAEAFCQVRLPDRTRVLWADAVCINQEDLEERAAQVQLMASIYENAKAVLASLGPNDGEAENGFRTLNHLSDICQRQVELFGSMDKVPDVSSEDLENYVSLAWIECQLILTKPWFSRVWVVQEVGLAKKVIILCGRFSIQWRKVVEACLWVTWKGRALEQKYGLSAKNPVNTWVTYSESGRYGGPILLESARRTAPKSFFDVLFRTRFHGATDPRDKIFAFLGHPLAPGFLSAHGGNFPISYRIPFQDMYTRTALNLLELMGNLRLLSTVQHENHIFNATLPSWVPSFHKSFDGWIMGSSRWPYYRTGLGGPPQKWRYSEHERALNIHGLEFDDITSVSQIMTEADFLLSNTGPLLELAKGTHSLLELDRLASTADINSSYPEKSSSLVLSYTLIFGVIGREAAEDNKILHLENYLGYVSQLHQFANQDVGGMLRKFPAAKLLPKESGWRQWMLDASRSCHNRCFFVTRRGFFGLGPSVVEVGDVCSIFFGGTVPFILRKKLGGHLLLGEAYLHGIMRGEAIEMLKRDELQEKVFKLI